MAGVHYHFPASVLFFFVTWSLKFQVEEGSGFRTCSLKCTVTLFSDFCAILLWGKIMAAVHLSKAKARSTSVLPVDYRSVDCTP